MLCVESCSVPVFFVFLGLPGGSGEHIHTSRLLAWCLAVYGVDVKPTQNNIGPLSIMSYSYHLCNGLCNSNSSSKALSRSGEKWNVTANPDLWGPLSLRCRPIVSGAPSARVFVFVLHRSGKPPFAGRCCLQKSILRWAAWARQVANICKQNCD